MQLGKRKAGPDAGEAKPAKKRTETAADVAAEADDEDVQLGKRKADEDEAPEDGDEPPAKREETSAEVAAEISADKAAEVAAGEATAAA